MNERQNIIDILEQRYVELGYIRPRARALEDIFHAQKFLQEAAKPPKEHTSDQITKSVCDDLQRRSATWVAKYGTTLDRADLNLREWLQHAYEECLDQAQYLKRAIRELEK